VYDGTVSATATPTITTGALASGDIGVYSQTYVTKTQGTNKVLTPTGIILDVSNVSMTGNYSLTYTAINNGVITAKQLTIADPTITKSKEYDKTVTVNTTAGTLSGIVTVGSSTDAVTVSSVGTYSTSTVGISKTITVVYTLAGADKDNYIKPIDKVYTDGVITVRSITVSATASDKMYDGNTTATATLTDNRISGDELTVNKTGVTFNNKNIGSGKTVTVSDITLTGTDAGNYTLTSASATGTASITVKSLTINATALDKVYDGNNIATVTLTDNKISGDDLMVIKTGATFNNKNAGPVKAVSVIGITLTGTDAGNYTLTSATATGTASITVKSLTITATASDKVYDGNTTATAILSDNRISGDVLTINKTGATFNNKNVASGKTFTVSGISLAGVDAVNYNIISSTATGTASITTKNLTVSAIAKNKPYDGNRKAEVTLTENKISGDNITTSYILAEFDTPEVGDNKLVTVSGIIIGGVDVVNYNLTSNNVTTNASITAPATIIFEIPNAFTPNGDGMNDELKIISNAGVRSLTSFKIFSRSGNLVFESRDLSRGWDGRYNGNLLPADIYYWTALYVDRNNVTNPKNGTVLLLK
jgi:gliding motility-associated-like protein